MVLRPRHLGDVVRIVAPAQKPGAAKYAVWRSRSTSARPGNEDDEGKGTYSLVAELKAAIAAADALVVVSPEYNHGIPSVLKNAIDWASRPVEGSALASKPVSVMTAAPSPLGGARARAQLRETFAATASRVMANRRVVIGGVGMKTKDGRLVDQPTLAFALAAIDVLLAEVRMLRAGRVVGSGQGS